MELGRVWIDEKKNRESPRILANRIFLAPSCSAPAYRLRRNRTPSGKMLSEKPVRKLSVCSPFRFAHLRAGFSGVLIL
jgi:hypothetical protein